MYTHTHTHTLADITKLFLINTNFSEWDTEHTFSGRSLHWHTVRPPGTCPHLQQVSSSDGPRSHEPLQPLSRVSLLKQRWQDDLKQKQLEGQLAHRSITGRWQRAIIDMQIVFLYNHITLNIAWDDSKTPWRVEWTYVLSISPPLPGSHRGFHTWSTKRQTRAAHDLRVVKPWSPVSAPASLALLVAHYTTGHSRPLETPSPWTPSQGSVPLHHPDPHVIT